MPVNYFPNATEAELLACAQSLQRRLTVGEVAYVTMPGGGQMQRTLQNTPQADLMLLRVLFSLHLKNPTEYDNPYAGRVRRTLPNYVNA